MMMFPFRTTRPRFVLLLFFLFAFVVLPTAVAQKAKGQFVLVIDAGHGGRDHGAPGKLTTEKHINLNVALAFGKLVEDNFRDVKVVYTRKTDVFVPLQTRAEIANRNKADLFVSIHTNAVERNKEAVSGAETYSLGMHRSAENLEVAKRENSVITQESNYKQTYQNFDPRKAESYIIFELMQDQNMKQSVSMAQCIQRQYAGEGRRNKGVKQAGFLVLHATSMPSVLTEVGFISHPDEERFLHSKEGVNKLARALYNAFRNYRRQQGGTAEMLPPEPVEAPQSQMAENTVSTATPLSSPKDGVKSAVATPAPRPQLRFMDIPLSAATQSATNGRDVQLATRENPDVMAAVVPVATRPFRSAAATPALNAAEKTKEVAEASLLPPPAEEKGSVQLDSLPNDLLAHFSTENDTPAMPAETPVEKLATPLQNPNTVTAVAPQQEELPQKNVQPQREKTKETPKPKSIETSKTKVEAPVESPSTKKMEKPAETPKNNPPVGKTPVKETPKAVEKTAISSLESKAVSSESLPEFRVQIFTSDRRLRSDDAHFKGISPIDYYQEGGRYKYTHGRSADLAEVQKIRKKIAEAFPEAFIIALLDGKRIDLPKAKELISAQKTTSKK